MLHDPLIAESKEWIGLTFCPIVKNLFVSNKSKCIEFNLEGVK